MQARCDGLRRPLPATIKRDGGDPTRGGRPPLTRASCDFTVTGASARIRG
jgi:hypothetical protein